MIFINKIYFLYYEVHLFRHLDKTSRIQITQNLNLCLESEILTYTEEITSAIIN